LPNGGEFKFPASGKAISGESASFAGIDVLTASFAEPDPRASPATLPTIFSMSERGLQRSFQCMLPISCHDDLIPKYPTCRAFQIGGNTAGFAVEGLSLMVLSVSSVFIGWHWFPDISNEDEAQ
jgi:hypothetical protein